MLVALYRSQLSIMANPVGSESRAASPRHLPKSWRSLPVFSCGVSLPWLSLHHKSRWRNDPMEVSPKWGYPKSSKSLDQFQNWNPWWPGDPPFAETWSGVFKRSLPQLHPIPMGSRTRPIKLRLTKTESLPRSILDSVRFGEQVPYLSGSSHYPIDQWLLTPLTMYCLRRCWRFQTGASWITSVDRKITLPVMMWLCGLWQLFKCICLGEIYRCVCVNRYIYICLHMCMYKYTYIVYTCKTINVYTTVTEWWLYVYTHAHMCNSACIVIHVIIYIHI